MTVGVHRHNASTASAAHHVVHLDDAGVQRGVGRCVAHVSRCRSREGRRCRDKRRGRRPGSRNVSPSALGTAARVFVTARRRLMTIAAGVLPAPTRLVAVVRVLPLVSGLLFFSQPLPAVLELFGLLTPLFAYQFGNLRVSEARVFGSDGRLVMLPVQNES